MITISELQKQVHELAKEKGWWPHNILHQDDGSATEELIEPNIPEKIALMHSELSEALEEYRKIGIQLEFNHPSGGKLKGYYIEHTNLDKPEGLFVELADCIIRILDLAGYYDIDMEKLILLKHNYNKTRPYRHGNKRA